MNVRKIINEVINEYYNEDKKQELEKFLTDSIDFTDYLNYEVPDRLKIRKFFDFFMSENGHEIDRFGIRKALSNYIQGLPSYLTIPHYYNDIKNLMYSLGYDEVKDMDSKEFSDLYYNELIDIILKNQKELQTI
jgi:hypothetical protein